MADVEALRKELIQLRKGPGVTPSKLRDCIHLLDLPAVVQRSAATGSEPWLVAMDLLNEALGHQRGSRYANALRNAWRLNVEPTGDTLTERREHFANVRERSPETIEVWENRALESILLYLTEAASLPEIEPAEFHDGGFSDRARAPVRPGLLVEVADVRVIVGEDRCIKEVEQRLTVRALRGGVTEFRRGVWSGAKPLSESDIVPLFRCSLKELAYCQTVEDKWFFSFLGSFDRMNANEFAWRRYIGEPDATPYWSYTPQAGAVDLDVAIQFPATPPSTVWLFDNLFQKAAPGLPTPESTLLLDDSRTCSRHFTARTGLESGIAWEW